VKLALCLLGGAVLMSCTDDDVKASSNQLKTTDHRLIHEYSCNGANIRAAAIFNMKANKFYVENVLWSVNDYPAIDIQSKFGDKLKNKRTFQDLFFACHASKPWIYIYYLKQDTGADSVTILEDGSVIDGRKHKD
jgi:hypothetical protein